MSRALSAKSIARRNLLASFLARESPASLPTGHDASSPSAFASPFGTNPFAPTKVPGSKSWTAPRYSLRRQKVLRLEAEALGFPSNVLPPSPASSSSSSAAPTTTTRQPSLYRASPHIPETRVLNELALEKKGPYTGRKGMAFKGKMWERKFEARQEELKKALEGADAKAAAWRKAKSDEKAKAKPSLPF